MRTGLEVFGFEKLQQSISESSGFGKKAPYEQFEVLGVLRLQKAITESSGFSKKFHLNRALLAQCILQA